MMNLLRDSHLKHKNRKTQEQKKYVYLLLFWQAGFLGKQPASRVQSSDKAQSETWALSLDHHVTGLRRPHTIISCTKAEGPVGATAAGSRRDESWIVRHAGRKSAGVENKKTARVAGSHVPALFLCLAWQEFSDRTFAVRASRMLVSIVSLHNEAERTFVVHVRHLQITYSMKSSDEVQLHSV